MAVQEALSCAGVNDDPSTLSRNHGLRMAVPVFRATGLDRWALAIVDGRRGVRGEGIALG
jgi:hypothetical protein